MEDYYTATEAAEELGISYPTLLARIRKGQIESVKKGWSVFVHKDEVARIKKGESVANPKDMEKRSR